MDDLDQTWLSKPKDAQSLQDKAFSGQKLPTRRVLQAQVDHSILLAMDTNNQLASGGLTAPDINLNDDNQWIDHEAGDDEDMSNCFLDTGWHDSINELISEHETLVADLTRPVPHKRNIPTDPKSQGQAMNSKEREHWLNAEGKEVGSLSTQGTWELVPPGKFDPKVVMGCKWVYKVKRSSTGEVLKYKARLVAQGFSQIRGVNYEETYSPVARQQTVMSMVVWANKLKVPIYQLDFVTAYLNGDIDTDVYMKQPPGHEDPTKPGWVCKMKKGLYGLKQSGRLWNIKLNDYLLKIGFTRSKSDSCMYTRHDGSDITVLSVYVDDVVYFSTNDRTRKEISQAETRIRVQDDGPGTAELVPRNGIQTKTK